MKMLSGLRSRWMMPLSCAAASVEAVWSRIVAAAIGEHAEVVDVDDVRVADLIDRAGLELEALDGGGILGQLRLEDLDRSALADQRMRCGVHEAHGRRDRARRRSCSRRSGSR